jgi:antitoxin (DNA-binding transcriptional repressor) of toxin-antitoxin stability system
MTALSLVEAQARLPQLIHNLGPGEEIVITENDKPLAKVTAVAGGRPEPIPGRAKGMLTVVAEDDEHLEYFKE